MPRKLSSPVIHLPIGATINTALDVIAAVATKRYRILQLYIKTTAQTTLQAISYNASTPANLTGAIPNAAFGEINLPYLEEGHFETVKGDSFRLATGASSACGGFVKYQEII